MSHASTRFWAGFSICIALGTIAAVGWYIWNTEPTDNAVRTNTQDATTSPDRASADHHIDKETVLPAITYATHTVPVGDGRTARFRMAKPFDISVAAEGLGKVRFMTRSPDGRIFVPDLVDYKLSHEGKLYILDDFNERTGEFETKHTYLSGLRGSNDIAFYTDETGQTWLYLALTEHLLRYPYEPGDTEPSGEPEVITTFPNEQAKSAESVVWHITRTIDFYNGRLFVSVGSGCNACEQPEGYMGGMIYSMAPDGSDTQVYARGLRNAVGFTWARLPDATTTQLFATENGVDHLGSDAPDDVMYRLQEGQHYGWPYCYEEDGEYVKDTSREWENDYSCGRVPEPFGVFKPHTAPLGLLYFEHAPEVIKNSFLVALHGSFDTQIGNGYKIMRVGPDGDTDVFMDGFLRTEPEPIRYGRPVDILQHSTSSFFFTDDHRGRIYWVHTR